MKKKQNHKSEEHFHDEWALGTSLDEIDVKAQFEGLTSPEYKEAIKLLGNVKNKTILNLGCGLGEEAVYLAMLGAKVIAIDISSQMLEITKKLAKKYHVEKRITYYNMYAENLEFKKNSFDAVLGCSLLHHVNLIKTVKEVKKVLIPGGIGVFLDPLKYNPVINIYRYIASNVRTDHEHPLSYEDIKKIKKYFPTLQHFEFQFFTLLIFVWFFLCERLNPNAVRYWKKIITDSKKYEKSFKFLYTLDKTIFVILPFLKRFSWVTVIKVVKER